MFSVLMTIMLVYLIVKIDFLWFGPLHRIIGENNSYIGVIEEIGANYTPAL